jgi:hypothetical protein
MKEEDIFPGERDFREGKRNAGTPCRKINDDDVVALAALGNLSFVRAVPLGPPKKTSSFYSRFSAALHVPSKKSP